MTILLAVESLSKSFGGLRAVDDVSFELRAGEVLGLIGPNGAGKTTLFNLVAGALQPTGGTVRLDGQDVSRMRPHRRCRLGIARTFQIPKPFSDLTVRDNLRVAALHPDPGRAPPAVEATLAALELQPWADRPAHVLPLGGRKRLEIARALMTAPRVVLLDEVLGGLSESEIADVLTVVRSIRAAGVSVIMIEHVLVGLMSLADRVAVLHEGRLLAVDTPAAVTGDPKVIEAYLGSARRAA